MNMWSVLGLSALSLVGAVVYRRLWIFLRHDDATPTGYGAFVAGFILVSAVATHAGSEFAWSYGAITAATTRYWFDDFFELKAAFWLALQFATGIVLCYLLLAHSLAASPDLLVLACVATGIFEVGMTNVINFYDGADLNLAMLMLLTSASLLLAGAVNPALQETAASIVAFVLPFAVVNSRPKSLYFGDAGCFAFASVLTAGAIVSLRDGDSYGTFAAVPLGLPVMDALYVLLLHIVRKEDLLSRNYLHLYQQLQSRYRNFIYLAPQAVAILLGTAATLGLLRAGLAPFLAVGVSVATVAPVFYFACRRLLLR
jgi:UDP-N-acetylmuramyl pentapeptide phosphotransferase/UDP-N-acetylglucosamine-1-phosphate transferase